MANTIQIKRSTGSSAPSSLSIGELAYTISTESGTASDLGDRLFIGDGSSVIVIGGEFYKKMLDHTAGTLTGSSAIVVDSDSKIDHLIVDNIDINGNAITSTDLNGNITITPNGSGEVVIDGLVHPQADGSENRWVR